MTIREKIGKLPVWKVAIVLILLFTFLIAGIEEIFVSRVFYVMDRMITAFEKEKKEENDEWEKEEKRFAELDRKWKQDFKDAWKKQDKEDKQARQRGYCRDYLRIKKIQTYLRQPSDDSKDFIIRSWREDERERLKKEVEPKQLIWLENAAKNKLFDPSTCKEDAS
jgi:hypothetical protein